MLSLSCASLQDGASVVSLIYSGEIDMGISHVEWNVYEDLHEKEAQVRKYIDGHITTQISHRFKWKKHGRYGAYEMAMKHVNLPPPQFNLR